MTIGKREYEAILKEWSKRDNQGFTEEGRRVIVEQERKRGEEFEKNYRRLPGKYHFQ